MAKNDRDYDNVFKTLKVRDTRLFIPVINDIFGKNYPVDSPVALLTSEGQLVTVGPEGEAEINNRETDMLLSVCGDLYILECQSYDDSNMAIRIAEYGFISALNTSDINDDRVVLKLPEYAVIYVKNGPQTPEYTRVRMVNAKGEYLDYDHKNVFIRDISKEEIIEKRLLPYIPFYVTRYEKDLEACNTEKAVKDLKYLRDSLLAMNDSGEIEYVELIRITEYVNTIIMHITDGNKAEREVTKVMGGVVLEAPEKKYIEKWQKEAREEGREEGVELGLEQANALTNILIAAGRIEDLKRAAVDREYQKKLISELLP